MRIQFAFYKVDHFNVKHSGVCSINYALECVRLGVCFINYALEFVPLTMPWSLFH